MNSYRHILLATDFSRSSETAAKKAAEIAACSNARLCLLHVVEHFPEDMPNDWIAPEDKDPADYMTERSNQELEKLGAQIGYDNIETLVILSEHSAAHEIAQYARQKKVDLIVTGHPVHHGIIKSTGATTSSIMHHVECDTLIVYPA
jgi:universal stress protein A